MRVSTDDRVVSVVPGSPVTTVVTVVNAAVGNDIPVIEAYTASVADHAAAQVEPASLALFPDASGELTVTFDVPDTEPAGIKVVRIQVRSTTTDRVEHAKVVLDVAARPAVALRSTPRMVRARRRGSFTLDVDNLGNVPVEAAVVAPPSESGVTLRVRPASVTVLPGRSEQVRALVKGPRMLTGTEVDRTLALELRGRQVGPTDDAAEAPEDLTASSVITLRQRPTISRGLVTAVILMGIVGLWAAIFLFGLDRAFKGDEVAKVAPPSFYPQVSGDAAPAADGVRTTFLPKDGLVADGVGGSISGTVVADSDDRPVGRVLVKAYRPCGKAPVSVAATQTDGTYLLTGLFPTSYRLQFVADGYDAIWLRTGPTVPTDTPTDSPTGSPTGPATDAPTASSTDTPPAADDCATGRAAEKSPLVPVDPQATTVLDTPLVISGKPGSVSGQVVVAGDAAPLTPTRVTLRPVLAGGEIGEESTVTTDADGGYAFTGLVAPASYQLTFSNEEYGDTSIVEELGGGEELVRPPVLLGADAGAISGRVVDAAGAGLGGVTVSTTVDGQQVSVTTPTQQDVGGFTLQQLPTPATYVVTVTSADAGTRSVTVELGPGEQVSGRTIRMTSGATSYDGTVQVYAPDGGGAGLGGVQITLGGVVTSDGAALTTTSLTGDSLGQFSFHDLAPGHYTLTFEHPDFVTQTQPITVGGSGGAHTFALVPRTGTITGEITDESGNLVVGATVTVTNGTTAVTAINGAASTYLPGGGYRLGGLEPGWYSVTATADGMKQRTTLVQVVAGADVAGSLVLRTDSDS